MRLFSMLVTYIFLQDGFILTKAKGGGRASGRGFGRGTGGRGSRIGRPFTSSERLSVRTIIIHRHFRGGSYVLSGHHNSECLPPLDAFIIKEFVEVTKHILRFGGTTNKGIELAEQFMNLDVDSSIQTWFDLTLELFNVQPTELHLNEILGIAIPVNPVDDNLSKIFSVDNNNRIKYALSRRSTPPENVKLLINYLNVFNSDVGIAPGVDICYAKYKQIMNPDDQNLLSIFRSLALLEHSMCRSGAGGKSYMKSMVEYDSQSEYSFELWPRTIKLGVHQEYVLSGGSLEECLPPLEKYNVRDFINITKAILTMGGTAEWVIVLAEQFMNLNGKSSIQTWFDLTLRLFNVTAMPLNLTLVLGREIPYNPLDDKLSEILSAENNDKIENALPQSPNVKDLMDYLRGFDSESYFFWIDYGPVICYKKYYRIVNPRRRSLSDVFLSLATLRYSMCRHGADNARQRSWNLKILLGISFSVSICVVIMTCLRCIIWWKHRRENDVNE